MDLNNLLTVAEAVTLAGLERKESRGAHFRDDFPVKDETYGTFNIVLKKGPPGGMQLTREPVPALTPEQRQVIEEMK